MRQGTGHPSAARTGRDGVAAKGCGPTLLWQDLPRVTRQRALGEQGLFGPHGFFGAQGFGAFAARGFFAGAQGFFAAQGLLGEGVERAGTGLHGAPVCAFCANEGAARVLPSAIAVPRVRAALLKDFMSISEGGVII